MYICLITFSKKLSGYGINWTDGMSVAPVSDQEAWSELSDAKQSVEERFKIATDIAKKNTYERLC